MSHPPIFADRLRRQTQWYLLQGIQKTHRMIRINWSIFEELERRKQPKIILCLWHQLLYCWHISTAPSLWSLSLGYKKNHDHCIFIPENEFALEALFGQVNESILYSLDNSGNPSLRKEKLRKSLVDGKTVWLPIRIAQSEDEGNWPMVCQYDYDSLAPIIPLFFSTALGLEWNVRREMIYPYPLSRIALCVGNPVTVQENKKNFRNPYSQIQEQFQHLEKLTKTVL